MGEASLVGAVTAEDYVVAVQLFAAYGRAIDTGAPTDEIMGLLARVDRGAVDLTGQR